MKNRGLMEEWSENDNCRELPKVIDPTHKTVYDFLLSETTFGQNPNNEYFVKLHIAQTKHTFDEKYRGRMEMPKGQYIDVITSATPETMARIFLKNLSLVGGPYGWANRQKYQDFHMQDIIEHMADTETSIYRFFDVNTQVGFCTVSGIKSIWNAKSYEKGIDKMEAIWTFARQQDMQDWPRPIEIYKFGLFPEYAGKGYGKIFLNFLTQLIFKNSNYNIIYLDTRDTNPKGTEHFYATQGYRAFYTEKLKNDLVKPVPWPPTTLM